MPPPTPLPKYVYKIVPSPPPDPLPEAYPLSELDQKDGFVHLSTSWQIPTTAGLLFASSRSIWILKIRLAPFEASTTWEVEGCPHLYGNFGGEDVESTREFARAEGQSWGEAFQGEGGAWLD